MSENTEFKDPLSMDYHGQDEMDVILGDDFFGSLAGDSDSSATPVVSDSPKTGESKATPLEEPDKSFPLLRGEIPDIDYNSLVERIQFQYGCLPVLNYDDLYQELADLSIECTATPSLEHINDELQKVQASKDRLSEILINVIKNHNFKKRAVDILQDAWGKFTSEKNAEARKGDGVFRLSNFHLDFALTESLLRTCTHVLKNLDSLSDNLSRRITIYQLISKNSDLGRGALPDHEWDRQIRPDGTFDKEESTIDEFGEIKPQNI